MPLSVPDYGVKFMNKLFVLLLMGVALYASEIYQVSTFKALTEMVYEGDVRYGDLFKKGDFGLGTFNNTRGEMVALDGAYYQDDPDGRLSLVRPSEKTPFAAVIFFKPEKTVKLKSAKSFTQFGQMLDHFISAHNTPHAVKVTGSFRMIKLRSLKEQEPPYQPLMQNDYEFYDRDGTLVGFWFPHYLDGINVGGFHFHFIDEKKEYGGHVLDFSLKSGVAELQPCTSLTIDFPKVEAFNHADLEVCP